MPPCSARKRRIGYPPDALDPDARDQVAGQSLIDLLIGTRKLPLAYRARRARACRDRARPARPPSAQTKMRLRALAIIKGELGTMEAGGHSNVIKYNTWWGWGAVAVLRHRHRVGVGQGRRDRVRQGLPLGQHRRHARRRQGRPQRHST